MVLNGLLALRIEEDERDIPLGSEGYSTADLIDRGGKSITSSMSVVPRRLIQAQKI